MTVCEKCWAAASFDAAALGGHAVERYRARLSQFSNNSMSNSCHHHEHKECSRFYGDHDEYSCLCYCHFQEVGP